jgi:hypothetical protein
MEFQKGCFLQGNQVMRVIYFYLFVLISAGVNAQDRPGISNTDTTIYTYIEQMPEFKGNIEKYLAHNRYTVRNKEGNIIKGAVTVTFIIGTDGRTRQGHIRKTTDSLLNADALRLISEMPLWKPAKQNGRSVDAPYTLRIDYK